ncbi:MAG: hypothetical protein JHD00_04710 [Akkermansiaceae bacterium]|nr:hypothetical protein [Akkermansiaceae bacterium]
MKNARSDFELAFFTDTDAGFEPFGNLGHKMLKVVRETTDVRPDQDELTSLRHYYPRKI